jgi:hypothetical protein
MDFRRSGPLDERRRRVLMDEIASPAEDGDQAASATSGSARGPVRAYHAAVLSERQPKVTDLLPVRPLWFVLVLLLGLTGIATIEAIHVHAAGLSLKGGAAHLAALDANQRGSLAAWYSSAILAAAATLALVVFGIRCHRVDDYSGHYRIWLWTAAALAWLCLDAATQIHEAVGVAVTLIAGSQASTASLAATCTITWIAMYALIFGALAMRVAFEVRASWLSATALVIAAGLYAGASLLELEMLVVPRTMTEGVVESSIAMLAHLSLLTSIGLYARHIYLDATGRLKVHIDPDRKNKKKARLKVVKETKPRIADAEQPGKPESAKFDSSTAAPSKPAVTISKGAVSSHFEEEDGDDDEYGHDNLSRSERRRLK